MSTSIHERLAAPAMRDGAPLFAQMREWAAAGERHKLVRWWGTAANATAAWLPWIMLNPSAADGNVNDPTLLRIIHFTWTWGFSGLAVFNVYPFRTSSPRELTKTVLDWDRRSDWGVRDTIWANHGRIARDLLYADAAMVAWGSPAGRLGEDTTLWIEQLFDTINDPDGPRQRMLKLWCLGTTKAGDPIHPLARGKHRIPNDARPMPYENPGTIGFEDCRVISTHPHQGLAPLQRRAGQKPEDRKMNFEKPFWVVWNPARGLPRYQHQTADEARKEARRLARSCPGENFVVMRAVAILRVRDPVEEVQFDEIPF